MNMFVAKDQLWRPPASPPLQPGISFRVRVTNADGSIISDTGELPGHSYLEQFDRHLRAAMRSGTEAVVDTGSSSRTIFGPATNGAFAFMSAAGASADDNFGILIGSGGATAVDIAQRALVTKRAHGAGTNQFDYGGTSFAALSVTSTTASYVITRVFTNNSGATISVSEHGIAVQTVDDGSTNRYFLISRETFTATDVPDTKTATIDTTISVSE